MKINRKGSLSIEASIVFSIFLALIVSVITVIDINKTDLLMQAAVDETCEKLQIIPPLCIPAQDVISTALNATSDEVFSELYSNEILMDVLGGVVGLDNIGDGRLENIVLSEVFGNLVSDDIANEYLILNDDSDFFMPDNIKSVFEINSTNHNLGITVTYSKLTIVGRIEKKIYSSIPMYGDFNLYFIEGSENSEEDDSIWLKDNFTRGLTLRRIYGANLPPTFPVIDTYSDGKATSIVSIDTTSSYYSNTNILIGKIYGEINQLHEFNGANVRINGKEYDISYVDTRELIIVIPQNDDKFDVILCNDIIEYGLSMGVDIKIESYGYSSKNDE